MTLVERQALAARVHVTQLQAAALEMTSGTMVSATTLAAVQARATVRGTAVGYEPSLEDLAYYLGYATTPTRRHGFVDSLVELAAHTCLVLEFTAGAWIVT